MRCDSSKISRQKRINPTSYEGFGGKSKGSQKIFKMELSIKFNAQWTFPSVEGTDVQRLSLRRWD